MNHHHHSSWKSKDANHSIELSMSSATIKEAGKVFGFLLLTITFGWLILVICPDKTVSAPVGMTPIPKDQKPTTPVDVSGHTQDKPASGGTGANFKSTQTKGKK